MDRRHFLASSVAAAVAASLPIGRLLAAGRGVPVAGDVAAVTGSGAATTLERAALQELRDSLRGALLLAGDAGYDEARRVLNESINKYPALIVQPTGVADIRNAVTFARERNLLLAVKCGGHSPSGKSTCDGGMQIDLSRFRSARVDPISRRAYVAGGSLLGEMDHETMTFDLVTTAGTVSHTGIGGLTLGGGFGRLARRFGLALDNVRSADVVTADGRLLHAGADENPDLYWSLRGGGGNFGIVTGFEFDLHPMQRQVIGGNLVFPFERAREILESYADFSSSVPDEMYADFFMSIPPGGKPGVCGINICYSGPADQAEKLLVPLRKLGTPVADTIKAQDYVAIQRSSDRSDPRNEGTYLKSGFISDFKGSMIDALINGFRPDPARATIVFFQHSGGAIGRIASDATAFPHRHSKHNMFSVVAWNLDGDAAPHVRFIKDYWATLEPFTDGYYTNEVGDEAQGIVDSNYQGNIGRLRTIKKKYDPGNLFRLNANVLPSA
jgi:FAD binding domain-containing protein/berberine-like enzyme